MKNGALVFIPLEQIVPSKTNPRKIFNDAELNEMAKTIKSFGLINPVTVRSLNGKAKGKLKYELVAGEKRLRASKIAGSKTIKALIEELTDEQVIEIQIIENLQRSDIHPMDEANGFKVLIDSKKYTQETIADKIGKSKQYIHDRLKLKDLIPEGQKYFLNNDLVIGHALLLCKLQKDDQKKALEHISNEGKNKSKYFDTVRQLRSWIDNNILLDLHKASFEKDNTYGDKLLSCKQCPKRTGFNKLLFDDIDKKDYCTDPACFHQKVDAHIKLKTKEFADNKIKLQKITDDYYCSKADVIGRDNYHIIKNKNDRCDSVIQGIYSKDNDNEVGKVIDICMNKNCKKHHHSGSSLISSAKKKTPDERYARKLEIIKGQEALELLLATSKNLIELDLDPVKTDEYYKTIIKQFWATMDSFNRRQTYKQIFNVDDKTAESVLGAYVYEPHKENKPVEKILNASAEKKKLFNVLLITALLSRQSYNAESFERENEEYEWYMNTSAELTTAEAEKGMIKEHTREEVIAGVKNKFDEQRQKVYNSFVRINGYIPGDNNNNKKGSKNKNKETEK